MVSLLKLRWHRNSEKDQTQYMQLFQRKEANKFEFDYFPVINFFISLFYDCFVQKCSMHPADSCFSCFKFWQMSKCLQNFLSLVKLLSWRQSSLLVTSFHSICSFTICCQRHSIALYICYMGNDDVDWVND